MNRKQLQNILKQVLKFGATALALYFVFQRIDVDAFQKNLLQTNLWFFAGGLLFFNLSKMVAAVRFQRFLEPLEIRLSAGYNQVLNYVGMFYNLFLPGSIGGDGYKVYLLRQQYPESKTRQLVSASLMDRLSGLVLLLIMACILMLFSSFDAHWPWMPPLLIIAAVLALPAFYVGMRLFFGRFTPVFFSTSHLSFWVQMGQVVCAWLLLRSQGIDDFYTDYLTLFMVSSVVAVLPFTVGGVGARELVFLYGFQFLQIEESKAIAFTILFFIVTAISSFIGFFFTFTVDKRTKAPEEITDR